MLFLRVRSSRLINCLTEFSLLKLISGLNIKFKKNSGQYWEFLFSRDTLYFKKEKKRKKMD
jgi:hypothetical protein